MPVEHRSLLLVLGLGTFFLVETLAPLFELKYNRLKHTGLNIFFTLTTVIINFALAFLMVKSSAFAIANEFGLMQMLNLPPWALAILGLMMMDFISAWLAHWCNHKVKLFWRFHLIHHTDQHVDTTTANRHHPGESVFRLLFTTLAVLLVGAPIWMIFLYQSCSLIFTQFNHANINMPKWLDNSLMLVFCTPNMHRVHHHYRQPYSDTNYGNIFSFWDRLFGTFSIVDNNKLKYGVDTHMEVKEVTSVGELLKTPFKTYRPPINYETKEVL